MNKTNLWKLGVAVAWSVMVAGAWGVTVDPAPPCWRDGGGTARAVWTFDTQGQLGPSVQVNQGGSPVAALTFSPTGGSSGYWLSQCDRTLAGCGTPVYAILPLSGTDECGGPPYLSNLGRLGYNPSNDCALLPGQSYTDPSTFGTGQGWWDMGRNGQVVLGLPRAGAPAGTVRYVYIQGTYYVSGGVAALPGTYVVSNAVSTGTRVAAWNLVSDAEVPLSSQGTDLPGIWQSQRAVFRLAADTAAGTDWVVIRSGTAWIVDGVSVETLDRLAQNDAVSMVHDTATNVLFSTLLANDLGGTFLKLGTASNGTAVTNSNNGGTVVFTPTPGFSGTASFWYTNTDCYGTNLGAQVVVTVAGNQAPVAGTDNYSRGSGVSMKLAVSSLLANDTDPDEGDTVSFVGASATTTNGAVLTVAGGYVFVPARSVTDRFTYTIQDDHGASATGTVNLSLVSQTGQGVGVAPTNGAANVRFYGVPGQTYVVQRATNIVSPVWVGIATNQAPGGGAFTVTDDFTIGVSGQPGSAYYRLLIP